MKEVQFPEKTKSLAMIAYRLYSKSHTKFHKLVKSPKQKIEKLPVKIEFSTSADIWSE